MPIRFPAAVDVQKVPGAAQQFNVRSTPTFVLIGTAPQKKKSKNRLVMMNLLVMMNRSRPKNPQMNRLTTRKKKIPAASPLMS